MCDEIKRRSLALTICPISNGYVVDGSKLEVIAAVLEAGLWVTVNSDNLAYFPGYMKENLIRVQGQVDLGKAGIVQLAENAFESAWLPRATKDHYIAKLKAYTG